MLTQHVALVPTAGGVEASELARVSAALQKQITRDLAPLWGVSATIDAFPELEDVPLGYWPILVSTGETNHQTGRLIDENGQPYAHVLLSPHWSVAASRACLEMLINPFGNRTVVSESPRYDQGLVQLLVEICAACEDPSHAYVVNDVLVSDFCAPAFFESGAASAHERCSFYGSISAPLQLLMGGHLTWFDSPSDSWWLRTQHDGEPVDTRLGPLDPELGSVRELARRYAPPGRRTWTLSYEAFETRARLIREQASLAAHARARRLRILIGQQVDPASASFEEVTKEFEVSDERPLDQRARLEGLADQSHEPVSDDELVAPLELVAPHAASRAPVELGVSSGSNAAPHTTEASVVASFVLPPPEAPAPEVTPRAEPTAVALAPARPSELHKPAREPASSAPPVSSIAPPALGLIAPERSREGVDARLVAGALVCAVLAVLAFTQRRASSTPGHGPQAPSPRAASAPISDAGLAPAMARQLPQPPAAPGQAPAASPAERARPASSAAAPEQPGGPAGEPKRRAPKRPRSSELQPSQSRRAASLEELFDTRR